MTIMKLSDCQISNIHRLASLTINCTSTWLWGKRNERLTITVAHRLAHLISRIESRPDRNTAIGAKWYLINLPRIHHENLVFDVLMPFINRLSQNLDDYEEQFGKVDENYLTTLITLAGFRPEHILYTTGPVFVTGPCFGSPTRELSRFISCYMWKKSLYE
jgi:hypothetical protein